jgi:hypothetical protein
MRVVYEGITGKDIAIRFRGTPEEIRKMEKEMQATFGKEKDCDIDLRSFRVNCVLPSTSH